MTTFTQTVFVNQLKYIYKFYAVWNGNKVLFDETYLATILRDFNLDGSGCMYIKSKTV